MLNREFFYGAPNHVEEFLPVEEHIRASLRLLKVSDYRKGHFVRVVMSDERQPGCGVSGERGSRRVGKNSLVEKSWQRRSRSLSIRKRVNQFSSLHMVKVTDYRIFL